MARRSKTKKHHWWHFRIVKIRQGNSYAVHCTCGLFLYNTKPQWNCYRCDAILEFPSADTCLCDPCWALRASIGDDR